MGDWNPSSMREAIRGKGRKEQRNVLVRPEARGRGLGRGFGALPTTAHLLAGQEHQAPRTAGLWPQGTLRPQLLRPTWVEGECAPFSTSWASRVFLRPYSSSDLPGGGNPQKPVPQLSQRHLRKNAQGASRNYNCSQLPLLQPLATPIKPPSHQASSNQRPSSLCPPLRCVRGKRRMASRLLERFRAFDWSYTSSPKAGVGGEAAWTPWSLGASREPLSLGWAKHCE